MVSLEGLRDQLRDALVALKAVMVDAVPADGVFFVRDIEDYAHVAGQCFSYFVFPSDVKWEIAKGNELDSDVNSCTCLGHSPDSLKWAVTRIESVLNSEHLSDLQWPDVYDALSSTFPAVFKLWLQVRRLYTQLVAADPDFLDLRAGARFVSVSQLPNVGLCTVQYKYPATLEVFPNGVSATVSWVALPEDAALDIRNSPSIYALQDVEGWPAERVEVVSALIREASSYPEAYAAFKLAEQLVP